MVTFEIRVPTYNRPELLRRALESLLAQTYPHWAATIYDDAWSAEEVARAIDDDRIRYSRNHQRLGACANMDQCFSPASVSGGNYACILEDDNFWLPDFLSCIAQKLENKPWSLIQANQRIWSQQRGLHPPTETTRGGWFSPGSVDPIQLRAASLFAEGLSTGGVIWKLDGSCNLQVLNVPDFGLQEVCRSLLVKSPLLFVDDALAAFNFMPKSETARSGDNNRSFGRGMQSIRRFILMDSGPAVIKKAIELADDRSSRSAFLEMLAHSGYPQQLSGRGMLKAFLKGAALRMTRTDPCSQFLRELKDR
jgi:glycosyltransferase involved in cell wall biosynthesis